MAESILNSWKDIAAHLHTSVRTAQRWEAQLHLPVHRPGNGRKGPILAFTGELDEWLKNGKSAPVRERLRATEHFVYTRQRMESLVELAQRISKNTLLLQQQLKRALELRKVAEQDRAASAAEARAIVNGSGFISKSSGAISPAVVEIAAARGTNGGARVQQSRARA